eukprot:1798873-Alexandrium_andersonii.AAC.1
MTVHLPDDLIRWKIGPDRTGARTHKWYLTVLLSLTPSIANIWRASDEHAPAESASGADDAGGPAGRPADCPAD